MFANTVYNDSEKYVILSLGMWAEDWVVHDTKMLESISCILEDESNVYCGYILTKIKPNDQGQSCQLEISEKRVTIRANRVLLEKVH
jgi:hypothetical protein